MACSTTHERDGNGTIGNVRFDKGEVGAWAYPWWCSLVVPPEIF